jgi:uncharacterized membrane protein YgcG
MVMAIGWLSRIKHFYNQQNTQQYITLSTSVITETIGITISNLALWFIPQTTEYSYQIIKIIPTLEWYISGLIICNIISWLCFLAVVIFEICREIWLIRTFDYSRKYSSVHLTKYKTDYPDVFKQLGWYNIIYYQLYRYLRIICVLNIIYSYVAIIYFRYAGYRTITSLFTNSWICYNKVIKGLQIGKECCTGGIGFSYYNTQNLSYNRIDARIKKHISNSSIVGAGGGSSNGGGNSNGGGGNLSVPASRLHSRRGSYAGSMGGSGSLNASWNSIKNIPLSGKNNNNNNVINFSNILDEHSKSISNALGMGNGIGISITIDDSNDYDGDGDDDGDGDGVYGISIADNII